MIQSHTCMWRPPSQHCYLVRGTALVRYKDVESQLKSPFIMEGADNIRILKLGVWKVCLLARSRLDFLKAFNRSKLNEIFADLPLVLRFFHEIFELGPLHFVIFILASAWKGLEHSLSLYFASHVIEAVSISYNL